MVKFVLSLAWINSFDQNSGPADDFKYTKIKDNPNKCIFMTDFQSSGKADEMFQITLYFSLYSTIVKRTMVYSEKKKLK